MRTRGARTRPSGQSLIEFILMLPVMLGLAVVLLKTDMAIQSSIVNQKYSRAQALRLADNSSMYPRVEKRQSEGEMFNSNSKVMVLGVSENIATDGDYHPEAQKQDISRLGGFSGKRSSRRSGIKIYNSVALCTQQPGDPKNEGITGYCADPTLEEDGEGS